MMTNDTTAAAAPLDTIEPEVIKRLIDRPADATTRRGVAAALALGSVPIAVAALSRAAGAQTSSVQSVLNFALMLEIFEAEFYSAVLGVSSSAAQNAAFAAVRSQVPAAALPALQQIQKHERSHVAFLQANGAQNVLNLTATSFDFTGARGAGNGPFSRATSDLAFLLLTAQAAEDTGVRAYKGQAGNLTSNGVVLEAALRIHSVEARHASKIRRLRRATSGQAALKYSGTVSGTGAAAAGAGNIGSPPQGAVDALNLIYANEGNTTQGGVNLTTLPNLPSGIDVAAAAAEAFDEPLTGAQVVAIVQGFFVPTIPASAVP